MNQILYSLDHWLANADSPTPEIDLSLLTVRCVARLSEPSPGRLRWPRLEIESVMRHLRPIGLIAARSVFVLATAAGPAAGYYCPGRLSALTCRMCKSTCAGS
jgi:hypothetical protein